GLSLIRVAIHPLDASKLRAGTRHPRNSRLGVELTGRDARGEQPNERGVKVAGVVDVGLCRDVLADRRREGVAEVVLIGVTGVALQILTRRVRVRAAPVLIERSRRPGWLPLVAVLDLVDRVAVTREIAGEPKRLAGHGVDQLH